MEKTVLARNLRALMDASDALKTQAAVGKATGLNQRTIGYILSDTHSPGLKQIEAIAAAFGIQPWQLLVPGLVPSKPPMLIASQAEIELFDKLRQVIKSHPPPKVSRN